MAADTFAGCASVFTLDMAINTFRIAVTADERVEAVVEIITHEKHAFSTDSCWIFILRLDDGDHLSWAGGIL